MEVSVLPEYGKIVDTGNGWDRIVRRSAELSPILLRLPPTCIVLRSYLCVGGDGDARQKVVGKVSCLLEDEIIANEEFGGLLVESASVVYAPSIPRRTAFPPCLDAHNSCKRSWRYLWFVAAGFLGVTD